MKAFIRFTARVAAMLVVLCVSLVVFNSCSEVTKPEDTVQAKLSVLTELRKIAPGGAVTVVPLQNVRITVTRVDGLSAPAPQLTNARGEAVLLSEASVAGDDFVVEAFSPDHGTRVDTLHGVCGDARARFVFREVAIADLNCNTLAPAALDIVFANAVTGSEKLVQNSPNPVQNCIAVARNSGRDSIQVELPTAQLGVFKVTAVQIDGRVFPVVSTPMRVTLPPGGTLGLCVDINTGTTSQGQPNGRFAQALRLRVSCSSGSSTDLALNLQATVVEKSCDCSLYTPATQQTLQLSEPVEVGQTERLSGTVFTNNGPCPVTVRVTTITPSAGRSDWFIESPAALRSANGEIKLQTGESLDISAVFSPVQATTTSEPSELTLALTVIPDGDPNTCNFTVVLSGESCTEKCPSLRLNGRDYPFGTVPAPRDSLYIRDDRRVFISDLEPSTVTETYDFVLALDDTLICRTNDVALRIEALPGDQHSLRYFELSDTRVALRTNSRIAGSFDVTITAPTRDELRQIILTRNPGGTPKTSDSMLTVKVIMEIPGCPDQELLVDAIITALPDFTPPIKMHAYRQTTPRQPKPEYEYYMFGDEGVRSLRNSSPPPPNGPGQGDLWVDVPNPNGPLPQQPFIKVESNVQWAFWQQITDESFFNNILQIVTQVQNGINTNSFTFNSGDITSAAPGNLAVGNVYIFRLSATRYAVMVIREINDGTENNLNNQSAIHFRMLYPVLL